MTSSALTQNRKAIVIGSGVAGMASAIRLAVMGFDVKVYERNASAGGKLALIEKDGYRFDAGPSLFTQPQNIEALFELAGEDMQSYFRYHSVPLSCRYFYESGKTVNAYTDNEALCTELQEKLGEDPTTVKRYLSDAASVYDAIGTIFLNYSLHKPDTWLHRRIPAALKHVRWPYLFSSLHAFNHARFRNSETVQLFDRFATYNGSDPYQTPGMMSLIPHLELNEGTFYPEGGMISITEALYRLAIKKGVTFHFNTPVQRIVHQSGKVQGVMVNDAFESAPVVVSNADVYFTYRNLLQDEAGTRRVLRQQRSCSGMIFYWGMNRSFPELHLHNIFFSKHYREEFKHIFGKGTLYHDPTVYVNITSKMEAMHAPQGGENWFLLINAPSNSGQDWETLRQQLRAQVIEKLSNRLGTDIAAAIAVEEYLDPIRIEANTGAYQGALYGTSSNSRMAAFLRHANFKRTIKGLYLCGGSVHPGGGIPLCFKSAGIVSDLVKKDFAKELT